MKIPESWNGLSFGKCLRLLLEDSLEFLSLTIWLSRQIWSLMLLINYCKPNII